MSCQCGDCAVCRGEKRPLFPRAAWSDPGRLKQRIEQAEASVMAEERQAQAAFKWARVGFSVALMVQVGLSAGCFMAKSVYGGPPPRTPSPQTEAPVVPPQTLQSATPSSQQSAGDSRPPRRPASTAQPLQPRPSTPEGRLTPGQDSPREVYGMPRRDPK